MSQMELPLELDSFDKVREAHAQAFRQALPEDWRDLLGDELDKPYIAELAEFVSRERAQATVFPPVGQVFSAFHASSVAQTRVLILGQDPYHKPGQAHGLSFSVPAGEKLPPSLRNIYKELESDLGVPPATTGNLKPWAKQGVLLLNAVLTVRQNEAASHKNQGWERFTDAVIQRLSEEKDKMVFVLWGNYARKKAKLIDARHTIIEGVHPSPLAAHGGFFGSRPFSAVNAALEQQGLKPIDWHLE